MLCNSILYLCESESITLTYFSVPILLVGNKVDLRNDPETIKECERRFDRKPVGRKEGYAMAIEVGAYAYLECSAKTRQGVRQVFEIAARAALLPEKIRRKLEQKSIKEKLKALKIQSLEPREDLTPRLGKLMHTINCKSLEQQCHNFMEASSSFFWPP